MLRLPLAAALLALPLLLAPGEADARSCPSGFKTSDRQAGVRIVAKGVGSDGRTAFACRGASATPITTLGRETILRVAGDHLLYVTTQRPGDPDVLTARTPRVFEGAGDDRSYDLHVVNLRTRRRKLLDSSYDPRGRVSTWLDRRGRAFFVNSRSALTWFDGRRDVELRRVMNEGLDSPRITVSGSGETARVRWFGGSVDVARELRRFRSCFPAPRPGDSDDGDIVWEDPYGVVRQHGSAQYVCAAGARPKLRMTRGCGVIEPQWANRYVAYACEDEDRVEVADLQTGAQVHRIAIRDPNTVYDVSNNGVVAWAEQRGAGPDVVRVKRPGGAVEELDRTNGEVLEVSFVDARLIWKLQARPGASTFTRERAVG